MAGKIAEAIVLVVDVGPAMARARQGGSSRLEDTIRIASQLVSKKMFQSPKDEIGLVLFGTKGTHNELFQEGPFYSNVTVMHGVARASTTLLRSITEIAPGPRATDFVDALVVAVDLLVRATADRKVETRRIVLFTDGASPFNADNIEIVADTIKREELLLQVAGVDADGGHAAKNSAADVLRNIVANVGGECFSFEAAMQNVSDFKTKTFKQTTTFRGNLEIGTTVKIPVYSYTYVSMLNAPTLKKISPVAPQSHAEDAMQVKGVSTYFAADDTELRREDLAKGFRYGNSLVPFLDADAPKLKMTTERRLAVIGFTQLESIPRHHYVDGVLAMVADPTDENASKAFGALFRAMYETGTAAIVRYVFRANAEPRLGFLSAGLVSGHECMLYSRLPFAEDVRQYEFASLDRKGADLSAEQLAAAEALVRGLDLVIPSASGGKPTELLKPKKTFNPAIQRFYQCVQHRALHPSDPIPPLEEAIRSYIEPNEALFGAVKGSLERMSALFPLKRVERRQEKGAAAKVWAATEAADLASASDERPAKRARTDAGDGMEILSGGPAVAVGSVNPVEDFQAMLARRDADMTAPAVAQMQTRIREFITTSIDGDNYSKALRCLRALRPACVKAEESPAFNSFLRDLKDLTRGRYSDLWDAVVAEGITLISADEAPDSTVTPEEAAKFLAKDAQPEAPPPAPAEEEEDWEAMMK